MSRSRKAALNHREARPSLSWPDHVHNRICKRGVVVPIAHRLTIGIDQAYFCRRGRDDRSLDLV